MENDNDQMQNPARKAPASPMEQAPRNPGRVLTQLDRDLIADALNDARSVMIRTSLCYMLMILLASRSGEDEGKKMFDKLHEAIKEQSEIAKRMDRMALPEPQTAA